MKKALLIALTLLHACPALCVEATYIALEEMTDNISIKVSNKKDEAESKSTEKKPLWLKAGCAAIILSYAGGLSSGVAFAVGDIFNKTGDITHHALLYGTLPGHPGIEALPEFNGTCTYSYNAGCGLGPYGEPVEIDNYDECCSWHPNDFNTEWIIIETCDMRSRDKKLRNSGIKSLITHLATLPAGAYAAIKALFALGLVINKGT